MNINESIYKYINNVFLFIYYIYIYINTPSPKLNSIIDVLFIFRPILHSATLHGSVHLDKFGKLIPLR